MSDVFGEAYKTINLIDVVKRGSDIEPELLNWLDEPFLPSEKLVIISGRGGTGKTTLILDWLARMSVGKKKIIAEGKFKKMQNIVPSLIFITSEDGVADTLLPRFMAAGGDPRTIDFIGLTDHHLDIVERLHEIAEYLEQRGGDMKVVVIDSITGMVGDADLTEAKVKQICSSLGTLAEKHNCLFIGVAHFKKGEASNYLSDMISGSGSWSTGPRQCLAAVKIPENDGTKSWYLGIAKTNIAPDILRPYKLVMKQSSKLDGTVLEGTEVLRVKWEDPVRKSLEDLLREITEAKRAEVMAQTRTGVATAGEVAAKMLDVFDGDLTPMKTKAFENHVRMIVGKQISERTFKTAKGIAKIVTRQDGQAKGSSYHHPDCACKRCEG